jgi:hypothetical protein
MIGRAASAVVGAEVEPAVDLVLHPRVEAKMPASPIAASRPG